jgi:hypothetical protein
MTKNRSIHVAVDTNILHTKSPHFFVNKSLSAFIKNIKNDKDVQIKWYLPSVVKAEREHQITTDTAALLSSVEAVERLLDEKLHVSKEKLNSAIQQRIDKQIT